MKKIFTIILGLSIGSSAFAQNNPTTGLENLHIFNDNTNHSLELSYTLFTIVPTTCSADMQGLGPNKPLPPGDLADYTTFMASTTAASHPYPIDNWFNGSYFPPSSIPVPVAKASRWSYMKFLLKDSNNPGNIPLLGGSVGFYQNCTSIPATISNSGTLNGINYSFTADAFIFGGDKWINVY